MKKKMMTKLLTVLALSSTALVFAGCGKKKTPTTKPQDDEIKKKDGFSYKVFKENDITIAEIVGIDNKGAELVIPGEIDGNIVTRMSCTYTSDELTKVVIPENLTYLTGNGFMNCSNLSQVEFEGTPNIANIPSKAFLGTKITSITIPASVISISYQAFMDIDTLTSVTFASGSNLSSIGPFSFYDCDNISSITLPSNIEQIADSAFEKCDKLATVSFANTPKLQTIDQYAFVQCESLTTLDLSGATNLTRIADNAFRGCINLESVTFNQNLKEIGNKAFYETKKIEQIVLPEKLIRIGDEAFVDSGLTSIELKSGSDITIGNNAFTQYDSYYGILIPREQITELTVNGNISLEKLFTDYLPQVRNSLTKVHITGNKIASNSYKDCVNLYDLTIDDTVKAIGESAFENCAKLVTIPLYDGIYEISKDTFKNCVKLENIAIPSSVKIIRSGAFDGCSSMNDVDLSNVVEIGAYAFRKTTISTPTFFNKLVSIGEYAFDGCENITSVVINTLESQTTTIKQYAFTNCINIESISLSKNVVMEGNAFYNDINVTSLESIGEYGLETLFGEVKDTVAKNIRTITVLEGTKEIEANAYKGCVLVTEINIPDTVTTIGDNAFRGCRGITTLNLSDSLTSIGTYAFAECDKLVISSLPDSVTEISEGLFKDDTSIEEFILNSNITYIDAFAFSGCANLLLSHMEEDTVVNGIGDYIEFIGDFAFNGCIKFEMNKLPDNLIVIGDNAFDGCLLVSVDKTNESLVYIGKYAFKGCQAIKSFEFAKDLTIRKAQGEGILEGCTKVEELKIYGSTSLEFIFGTSVDDLKPVLSKVTIKEGSTELADNMFKGFTAISDVTFESEIKKIGESAFQDCESLTIIDISNVEEIGNSAFAGSGLVSITIPSTGIKLGTNIFEGCISLAELLFEDPSEDDSLNIKEIPKGTFSGTILMDVILPNSVKTIGPSAFSNILTLNSFAIDDESNLEEIGASAFSGCSNILNFFVPKKVKTIGKEAFSLCQALKYFTFADDNALTEIPEKAFYSCYALTIILNLPDTITTIGTSAFEKCGCLTEIDLPESLDTLGESVFAFASSLNNVTIPEKVEAIPANAFNSCYMLEVVNWNANVKTIGASAFYNTHYLSTIPGTIQSIGESAFSCNADNSLPKTFEGMSLSLGTSTSGVSLSIGKDAFKNSSLISITLGSKIVNLDDGIFAYSKVKAVDFTDLKITKIGDSMFEECKDLETVTMGGNNTINTIGKSAFKGCTKLENFSFIYILSIGDSAFENDEALSNFENDEVLTPKLILGTKINVTIGSKAFYNSGITSLTLGAKVIKIGNEAFSNSKLLVTANLSELVISSISDSFFTKCVMLKNVSINENIRTIGANAFNETAIEDILFIKDIPVERIMNNAFASCKSLEEIEIPNSVSYVGAGAFQNCTELTSVVWSESCNVINDNTFNGCNKLLAFTVLENVSRIGHTVFSPVVIGTDPHAVITFESETPASVEEDFISDYKIVDIVVPTGCLEDYMKNYVFSKKVTNISEA